MKQYWRSHYIRIPDGLIKFLFPLLRPLAMPIWRRAWGWWTMKQFKKSLFHVYIQDQIKRKR